MLVLKNLPTNAGDIRDAGVISGSRRSPGEGNSVFLPGKSHGQRRLVGYSLQCCRESDLINHLSTNPICILILSFHALSHC